VPPADDSPAPVSAPDVRTGPAADESAEQPGESALRSFIHWVAVILAALVVALAVKTFLFQAFAIPSGSMEPTLHSGDRVIVNKLAGDVSDLGRSDVIVFERPDHPSVDPGMGHLIKRVVGLPGDRLSAPDGQVHVDGVPLEEPYLRPGTVTDGLPALTVPEGHVFVLGDNRDESGDSRRFGALPAELVVGRAFIRVWPIGNFGGL
jgi:signal peptidase I